VSKEQGEEGNEGAFSFLGAVESKEVREKKERKVGVEEKRKEFTRSGAFPASYATQCPREKGGKRTGRPGSLFSWVPGGGPG